MTKVFATINLKGGVGKTTTTVALAEVFSAEFDKRVLVVDLDPQTNATTMLIEEKHWKTLNKKGHTLARLFEAALYSDRYSFDLTATLQKKVSSVDEVRSVDLLPSSIDLMNVQDKLANVDPGEYFAVSPIEILRRAVGPILDDYDIVIVDCPPNLGVITLNGLRISDGYVIPTIPDVLSTYGIPQIRKRVSSFSEAILKPIMPMGIVVTKFQKISNVHKNTLRELQDPDYQLPVFTTVIPQAERSAAAAENVDRSTIRQKWGYGGLAERYIELAREILEKLEKKP